MTVYALAGRRPDRPDAEVRRFPLANRALVANRLETLFTERHAEVLVCSAACGADLIALEIAGRLAMNRHVLLPFDRARFRKTSVVDRPGEWGPDYDCIVAEVEAAGDLTELGLTEVGDEPYRQTNDAIIEKAAALADDGSSVRACLVWEGVTRDPDDITYQLARTARARGWPIDEVLTL